MTVQAIPEGYDNVIPYLAVDDAARAIDFYKQAFGAKERMRMAMPDGKIGHAEIEIGGSVVMLADAMPDFPTKSPAELGGTTVSAFFFVDDVDATVKQAVSVGATISMEVADQFWGDRYGTIVDPFGHLWQIATHVEDLAPEQIAERAKEAMASSS
jgi:PhnB protein